MKIDQISFSGYLSHLAGEAGATEPIIREQLPAGVILFVDPRTGRRWTLDLAMHLTSCEDTPDDDAFDQGLALEEGWCIMSSEDGKQIERDDEATHFRCDSDAEDHVNRVARAGSYYHQQALRIANHD